MLRYLPLLLLTIAACSASRPAFDAPEATLPSAFPNHSAAEVVTRVQAGLDGLTGLNAQGDLAVTSPQQSGNFSMRMQAAQDGHLYFSIRAFGIEGARVLVRPDSFFVYNRIEKSLTLGSMDDAQAALPVPLTAEEGFATVTGTLVPPLDPGWSLRADSSLYYLASPDGREVYTVDPALWRVVRTVRYTPDGALDEERRFDRFAEVDGQVVARRVMLHRPADRVQATLLYRDLDVNPATPPPTFLEVGADVRREPVGSR